MKFSVSSAALLKKLSLCNGAIGSNPLISILEDFLFVLDGNVLTISATNLETRITTSIEVSAEESGEVAVPARMLIDTLKGLPDQPINFEMNPSNFGVEITSSFGKYKLTGVDPEDFPSTPEETELEGISVSSEVLGSAVANCLFATSNDELRLAMTGLFVQIDYKNITFVATDAHKLVKFRVDGVEGDVVQSFIIPKKGLALLKSNLSGDETVSMNFNKTNIFFESETWKIVIRLLDAAYPDYNSVIPQNNTNELSISKSDLLNSLKRISIYSNKSTYQVVLNINEGSLTMSAQDLDFSNEATEQLTCAYGGEPMTIGFNAKYLIEMLNVIQSDEVTLLLENPETPGILLPAEQNENEELKMLVMPVMTA